jgi:hypothetical protein
MKSLLTTEEKKYLRVVSNYLNSLGMRDGVIDFDVDYGDLFDPSEINWNQVTHFSNNYRAEIPNNLIDILKKVMNKSSSKFDTPTEDSINWENVSITIDTKEKVLTILHSWSYTTEGDTVTTEWDYTEEEDVDKMFKDLEESLEDDERGEILVLRYDGGGDSGYIESDFENGERSPDEVENWCYQQLEENFGGWEINEGSQGEFQFDFNEKTVILSHTYNIEESKSNTLWEEEF